jgi:hypothetical protein
MQPKDEFFKDFESTMENNSKLVKQESNPFSLADIIINDESSEKTEGNMLGGTAIRNTLVNENFFDFDQLPEPPALRERVSLPVDFFSQGKFDQSSQNLFQPLPLLHRSNTNVVQYS